MQTSSLPKRLPVPFAQNGDKKTIPVASQVGIEGGRASYNDGFPVLTRTPLSGGGIPPFGTDFNGVLNEITAAVRWQQSGGGYPYDSDFSTTVSGYPKGSLIPNSTNSGFWLNTVDANTTNPENTTSALTGWVPSENYGVTAITGLSASSVTLSTLQASKERITLAGTLTSNINIIIPAWTKRWTVINNCTGNFTVNIKTPSGNGVPIPSGSTYRIVGDGTNINQDFGTAAERNVGTGTNQVPDVSSFVYAVNGNGAYRTMPGSLQICRFLATVPANGSYIWTYPLAFTAVPGVYYSTLGPSANASLAMWFNGVGSSNCSIFNPNNFTISANLLAIF